jgi:membrane-associated phospholipid phosphatase
MTAAVTALRPLKGAFVALLVALAALYGLWLIGWTPYPVHWVFFALLNTGEADPRAWVEGFAGFWQVALFVGLASSPWSAKLKLALAGIGIALTVAYQLLIGTPMWWLYLYSFFSGAGLVMMGFLIHQCVHSGNPVQRSTAAYLVRGILIFIGFGLVTKTFLLFSSAHAAPVLDWSALKLDAASFGFSPSAWAWNAVRENGAVRRILAIAYEALPLAMAAVFGIESRNPARMPFGLLKGLFVCGFVAAIAYSITPVSGPVYALGPAFPGNLDPFLEGAPGLLATAAGFSPRNAFPSMHWGWALLTVLLTAHCRWPVRIVFLAYALVIAGSTLALGEHYLVDLIASFPVMLAIVAVCVEGVSWRNAERRWAAIGGLGMYLAWSLMLRPSIAKILAEIPVVMSGWCVLSVAASLFLHRRLMLVWERRIARI